MTSQSDAELLRQAGRRAMYGDNPAGERRFTRDEVLTAINAGAQLVQDDGGIYLSDRDTDLVNLIVNAAGSMLDDPPPASLDEVAERCYQADPACAVCGGDLELSDQYPEAGYVHMSGKDDTHQPVLRNPGDVIRGWISG
jgi:hypothetical protein